MTPQADDQEKFSIRHNLGLQLLTLYLLLVIPILAGALAFDSFANKDLRQSSRSSPVNLERQPEYKHGG